MASGLCAGLHTFLSAYSSCFWPSTREVRSLCSRPRSLFIARDSQLPSLHLFFSLSPYGELTSAVHFRLRWFLLSHSPTSLCLSDFWCNCASSGREPSCFSIYFCWCGLETFLPTSLDA